MKKLDDNEDGLTGFLSVRVTPADLELLEEVTKRYPHAKRGEIARQTLRRGLTVIAADASRDRVKP